MKEIELRVLDPIEMGKRIRNQREFLGMSREELAGQLGVSSKFIADIEYGEKGISIKKLYLLKQILGISTDFILAGGITDAMGIDENERLKDYIFEPLKGCNEEQLKCMEQIVKFYVQGLGK